MIGKESIAFNDRTGTSGDFLEKLLDFYFKLHARARKRGRRVAAVSAEQEPLELTGTGGGTGANDALRPRQA
jgi:hypothetical protein